VSVDPRRERFSCRATKRPSHVPSQLRLDGKPTKSSNRHTSTHIPFASECLRQSGPSYRQNRSFLHSRHDECVSHPCGQARTKSTSQVLSSSITGIASAQAELKSFIIHRLPRYISPIGVDKLGLWAYVGVQNGGSRVSHSTAMASGSVPGALDIQGKEARS
jgi:hypothetical protein